MTDATLQVLAQVTWKWCNIANTVIYSAIHTYSNPDVCASHASFGTNLHTVDLRWKEEKTMCESCTFHKIVNASRGTYNSSF